MVRLFLFIVLCFIGTYTKAQEITGNWEGILKIQPAQQLRIVFDINSSDTGYVAIMYSPDQIATGIPVTNFVLKDSIVQLQVANIGVEYEGTIKNDSLIVGTFKQSGMTIPLDMLKKKKSNN